MHTVIHGLGIILFIAICMAIGAVAFQGLGWLLEPHIDRWKWRRRCARDVRTQLEQLKSFNYHQH